MKKGDKKTRVHVNFIDPAKNMKPGDPPIVIKLRVVKEEPILGGVRLTCKTVSTTRVCKVKEVYTAPDEA